MMKKIITTAFVLLTFVIYSVHQRGETTSIVPSVSQTTKQTTATAADASSSSTTSMNQAMTAQMATYKDGSYTGSSADAYYGYIQVKAIISGGQLIDVQFLQHPKDQRNSVEINNYAMPILKQQAIKNQTAQVDGVSGASDTSQAFVQSLGDALSQAKA